MLKNYLFWFLILTSVNVLAQSGEGIVEWKLQPCNTTNEPVQVAYSNICDQACIEECNHKQGSLSNCISLPKYCEGLAAKCGPTGCECIPSSRLPGNPYSLETVADHVIDRITCESDAIRLHVKKCAVNALGFSLKNFYINGITNSSHIPSVDDVTLDRDVSNTCVGSMEISEDGLRYLFEIQKSLAGCNSLVEADENSVTYTNAIKATTRKSIFERYALYVMFSCTFKRAPTSGQIIAVQPTSHDVQVYSGKLYKDFEIIMKIWEEDWFEVPYVTTDSYDANAYIYITINAEVEDAKRFNVQILKATLAIRNLTDDTNFHSLIRDGCATSDQISHEEIVVERNGESLVAKFKFRLLKSKITEEEQLIYVHVVAHLCDEIFEGDCKRDCSARLRRDLNPPEQNTRSVTSPPIKVSKWQQTVNETGHNITVMQALDFITESWEINIMIGCILLLILTLMISMCVLLIKLSNNNPPNALKDGEQ